MQPLIERFKSVYGQLYSTDSRSALLASIYDDQVKFVDPFHQFNNLTELQDYLDGLYSNVLSTDFSFTDEHITEQAATVYWTMSFQHPNLRRGKLIAVEGLSKLEFSDKINFHRDYFDGGALLYEHLPLFGSVINYLKKRMAS